MAARYVWWKTPEEALKHPRRVIAQVMNIGDYRDVQSLANAVGGEALKDALMRAEVGEFSEKSWIYWHLRLGLERPPMPVRWVE
jgi:hypothetical protein